MGSHAQGGLHGAAVHHHRCKSSTQNKCLARGRWRRAVPKKLGACVLSAHIYIFPGLFQSLGLAFPACRNGVAEVGRRREWEGRNHRKDERQAQMACGSPRAGSTQEAGLRLDQAGEDQHVPVTCQGQQPYFLKAALGH